MKYLGYVLRNARRNPVRSVLTVASITVCLALVMILYSFFAVNDDVASSLRVYNRIIAMSSQGFAQPVPIARVGEIRALEGVTAATPFSWYGGKLGDEVVPFAQFGVDPEALFRIYDEFRVPPDQLRAFAEEKTACAIGRKLAEDRGLKLGDKLPLKGTIYPFDLDLTVRAIYDGPSNRDLRMCFYRWDYLDEGLKRAAAGAAGNAGIVVAKCDRGDRTAPLCARIDELYRNSDTPTRTQTEEAFNQMFAEYFGSMKWIIFGVGMAVVASLVLVAGNAMAMAMRERTTEVAVLKAIGFGRALVLSLVLAEAMLVAGLGGVFGSVGAKLFFDAVDISPFTGGFLPFFYVPWTAAIVGLVASLGIGLLSGIIPALQAAHLSVIQGLRKVV